MLRQVNNKINEKEKKNTDMRSVDRVQQFVLKIKVVNHTREMFAFNFNRVHIVMSPVGQVKNKRRGKHTLEKCSLSIRAQVRKTRSDYKRSWNVQIYHSNHAEHNHQVFTGTPRRV